MYTEGNFKVINNPLCTVVACYIVVVLLVCKHNQHANAGVSEDTYGPQNIFSKIPYTRKFSRH